MVGALDSESNNPGLSSEGFSFEPWLGSWIALCWAPHLTCTVTVPLSVQVYEWVLVHVMLRVVLLLPSIVSKEKYKLLLLVTATETEIRSGCMGHWPDADFPLLHISFQNHLWDMMSKPSRHSKTNLWRVKSTIISPSRVRCRRIAPHKVARLKSWCFVVNTCVVIFLLSSL